MSIIYLEDRQISINSQHIARYYKFAEKLDRLVTSTHKLIAEPVGTTNHVDSGYDDAYYDSRNVIFEGTEAECVARHANLMDQLSKKKAVICYEQTVGTPLGIQEFVNWQCAAVKGEVISAKHAKELFLLYFDKHFPKYPVDTDIDKGYQHRPFGMYSNDPHAPDTHQFIIWMYNACMNLGNMHISALYQNGTFSIYDNYNSDYVDIDQVFFANLTVEGQMKSEPVPDEIMQQVKHLKEEK